MFWSKRELLLRDETLVDVIYSVKIGYESDNRIRFPTADFLHYDNECWITDD